MQRLNLRPKHVVHSIKDYIELKETRQNTPAMLTNGEWLYLIGDEWVSQTDFDCIHPAVEYKRFNPKGVEIGKYANL